MQKLHKIIYLIFGGFAILFGTANLVAPAWLVREALESRHLAHSLREQGAAVIFLGSVAVWCAFNYERSKVIHYLLTLVTFLDAAIHWFDFSQGRLPLVSPIYNTVPFLIFGVMAFQRSSE